MNSMPLGTNDITLLNNSMRDSVIEMPETTVGIHFDICKELNTLYAKKNHDYGDSFHKTFLEEGYAMSRIRLSDKLERFKTLSRNSGPQQVTDESLEDTLKDLANYAVMTIIEMRRAKENG